MRRAALYLTAIAAGAALSVLAGWRLTLLMALVAAALVAIGALVALTLADRALDEPGDDAAYGDHPAVPDGFHHGGGR